jgi:hypothetical protein
MQCAFIGAYNKTLPIVAMRVRNEDHPIGIFIAVAFFRPVGFFGIA